MLSANERITPRQFQILFLLEAFGTGFVVLPRLAAEHAGQDGWLVALLLLVPGLIFVTLVAGAAQGFGGERFTSYTRRLLSAPIAAVICLLLWVKILFCAGLELRLFGEIVRALMLRRTPSLAVFIVVLTVAAYAAARGIETRARLAEILTVVIAIPLAVIGAVAFFNVDFTNLMPALVTPPESLARGVLSLGFIFTGIEFIWLAFPYLNKPQEGRHAAVFIMAAAIILMTVITAFTLAKFGPNNVLVVQWPVLKMMDILITRQEALILSFWMLSVFAFAAASLFYAAVLGRDQVNKGEHPWWVLACAVIIFAVAMIPFSTEQIYWMLDRIFLTFGLGFWVVLPILLMGLKKLRGFTAAMLLVLLPMTGCWDGVELENRVFAVAIGIDTSEDKDVRFSLSAATARPENESGSDEGEDEDNHTSVQGRTPIEAIRNLDARSSRKLFLGQTKTVVLGNSLLEDNVRFREAITALENHSDIDRRINVLATRDSIPEIISAHPPGEPKPGYYVVNFNRLAAKSGGRSLQKDLESLLADLRATGKSLIPVVQEEGGDIKVEGAVVISNFQKAGTLDGLELRGLMWAGNKACEGAILTAEDNIPMVIRRHRGYLGFSEDAGRLRCTINVRVRGDALYDNSPEYERIIAREIQKTAEKLQRELEIDAFNLKVALWKQNYALYQKYANDWPQVFKEMEIVPVVSVVVNSN